MKTIEIVDSGRRYSLLLREDVDLPDLPIQEVPARVQFISWWREQAAKRGIPYSYGLAEPGGFKIVQRLLEHHTLEELQALAIRCFLDHGDALRSVPAHFAVFASLVKEKRLTDG